MGRRVDLYTKAHEKQGYIEYVKVSNVRNVLNKCQIL